MCASSIRLLDRPKIHHLFAFKFSHKALKPRSLKCVCRLPPVKRTSKSYSPSDSTFSDSTLKTSLVSVYRATALTKDGNGCDRGFSFVSAQCTNGVDTLIFPRSEFMQIKSEKMLKYANGKTRVSGSECLTLFCKWCLRCTSYACVRRSDGVSRFTECELSPL